MDTTSPPKTFICSSCKRQSAIEAVFQKKKLFLGLVTRYYCPDCQLRQQKMEAVFYYLVIPLAGVILYFVSPTEKLRLVGIGLALCLFTLLPVAVLHELAHALVAYLVGFRAFGIQLGIGRQIYSGKLMGLKWDLRMIPIGGLTFIGGAPSDWYRLKMSLIYLAGPMVHVVLAVVFSILSVFLVVMDVPAGLFFVSIFLSVLNTLLFFGNLLPIKFSSPVGMLGTDGWQLFQSFSWKPETYSLHYAAYYAQMFLEAKDDNRLTDARHWLEKGLALLPDDPGLLNLSGFLFLLNDDPGQARQVFMQLLERPGLELAQRCLFLNNVAYADIVLEDPALLPEADRFSAEAYQHLSWEPAITGTRGLVLLMLGKPKEGLPLLYSAFKNQVNAKSKAAECCYIAIGESRLGNRARAETYLATARQLDPACPILARAERELMQVGPE